MYQWLVYLHILGVFGFLLSHGASASVAFALHKERNPERLRTLLTLSANSYPIMYLSLLILLVTGIITGVMGDWWGRGWIWTALGLLLAILVAMYVFGTSQFGGLRQAVGLPYSDSNKMQLTFEPATAQAIDTMLAKGNPHLLALVGFGGIAVVAWLMMFKLF